MYRVGGSALLALALLIAACDSDDPVVVEPATSADAERVSALLAAERAYVDALVPANEIDESAKQRYANRLAIFELGVTMSENVEYEVCSAGLPLEREALAGARDELPDSSLWDRYEALLDEIEALLCREYDALTLVGDRYVGTIGDFRVNDGSRLDGGPPCSASIGEFGPYPSDHRESELWSDVFSERAQPNFCADDDRLLAIFEYTDEAIVRRGYFYVQPLAVGFNVLRAEPELIEIDGHPAIVGIDERPSEQVYLYAIERFPDGETPGIFVSVLGSGEDVDRATELAAQLLN